MLYALLAVLVLVIISMVADHKDGKKQKLEIDGLKNYNSALNEKARQKDNHISECMTELDTCRRVSEQRQEEIKMLTAQVDDYKDRLANAVEGLSPYDVKVLRAEKNNEYIYDVRFPDGVSMTVEVPMDSKYPDYVAKRKAGAKSTDMKNVRATRRTL